METQVLEPVAYTISVDKLLMYHSMFGAVAFFLGYWLRSSLHRGIIRDSEEAITRAIEGLRQKQKK